MFDPSTKEMSIVLFDECAHDLLMLQQMLKVAGYERCDGYGELQFAPSIDKLQHLDLLILVLGDDMTANFTMLDTLRHQLAQRRLRDIDSLEAMQIRPLLVVLNHCNEQMERAALQHGASMVLTKPLDYLGTLRRGADLLRLRQQGLEAASLS